MSLGLPHGPFAAAFALLASYSAAVVLMGALVRHPWRALRTDIA